MFQFILDIGCDLQQKLDFRIHSRVLSRYKAGLEYMVRAADNSRLSISHYHTGVGTSEYCHEMGKALLNR